MNKLSTSLAIFGLLTPVGAQALGVGEIRLQSFLNQALRAEIPLVLSEEKLGDIRVSLAPPKDFEAAGLELSPVLAKLRFDVQPNVNGNFAIRVRSGEIIREPFLSFLVELTWPQGRMLRSFTVLLDPPEVSTARSYPAASPEIEGSTVPIAPRPIAAPVIGETNQHEGEYGPVGRNEKLWAIAEKVNRDPSITPEQMVIALFRFNPRAFSRPSVNALNAGSVLRIPERDYILAISPAVAREEFYRHQAGRTLRGRKEIPRLARSPSLSEPSAALPPDLPNQTPRPARSEPYVRSDAGIQAFEALKRENEEMRMRLAELEKRVAELQNLFSEKETPSPNVQPAGTSERNIVTSADPRRATGLEAPAPAATNAGAAASSIQGAPVSLPGAVVPKAPHASAETLVEAPTAAPAGASPVAGSDSGPVTRSSSAAADGKPTATAPESPSHTGWWLLAGAGAALAGLATFHVRRLRKIVRSSDTAYAAAAPTRTESSDQPGSHPTATEVLDESQIAPAKADSEDVDPIFEANIYVSYGKYGQARETLENAIRKHPGREAYRLKLLEIYLAQGDRQRFQDYVGDLKNQTESAAGPFWDRVTELARRFSPENGFSESEQKPAENVVGSQAVTPDRRDDDTDRLIDDLKRFSLEARGDSSRATPETPAPSNPYVYDKPAEKADKPSSAHDIPWVPVDAGHTPTPSSEGADEAAISPVDSDHLIPFDPGSTPGELQPSTFEESATQSIDTLLKELSAIHYERHLQGDASDVLLDPLADNEPRSDLARTAGQETGANSAKAADVPVSASSEDDGLLQAGDLETKLDLARAYADMGDYAQAKDFLREVIEQGSDQQKAEAAELLATFSGREQRLV